MKQDKKRITTDEERKEVIIKVLTTQGRMSTTKLCFIAFGHTDYKILIPALFELVAENKILQEEETNATYYSIKKGDTNEKDKIQCLEENID